MRNPTNSRGADYSSQSDHRQNYFSNEFHSSTPVVNNLVPHNRSGEIFSRQESSVDDDNYYYNNNISESAYNDNGEEYERNNFRGEQQSSIDLVARSCHPWNVPFDNRLHHKVEKGYASEILVYKVAHYLIVDFPSRNFFFFFFF